MKQPYEFLVRWDHMTGELKGAHVKFYDTATQREGDAESVAIAGAAGFPISDVLTAIESGAILAMDAAKEAADAAKVVAPAPSTKVSMRQARLALLGAGLLDDVEAGIAGMDKAAQIDWQCAESVERNSALVATLGTALGLDDAAVDGLFAQAATL